MPHAPAADGVSLYFEDTGSGPPVLFLHEYAGEAASWRGQVAALEGTYRCIVTAARGYPGSDVPENEDAYGQDIAINDAVAVLDDLDLERAHVVGLSMGAYTALRVALAHPGRVASVVAASGGAGSLPATRSAFVAEALRTAGNILADGTVPAEALASGPTRVQYRAKDPAGWAAFRDAFAGHDPIGAALTLKQVQAARPSLYEFETAFREVEIPVLLMVGDEDDPCLDVNLFLKRTIPTAGLLVFAKSGHLLNLEEPERFNRALLDFLEAVGQGKWEPRATDADPNRGSLSGAVLDGHNPSAV